MKVQISNLPKSTVELTIEVDEQELAEFEKQALQQLATKVEIAGFRPGKAPLAMARKHIDPVKLLEETANIAIPRLYGKAVLENKLEAIGSPRVEIVKFAPGNPLVFKAVVAVLPKFDLPDYRGLHVKHEEVKVTDAQIERFLRQLQRSRATEKTVTRAAQMGDAVEIDFDITQNKVPLEHGSGKKHPAILGDGVFVPGFEEELVGLSVGQEKDFSLTFPEDYNKKSLAGKKADVHVKMLSIRERVMPPIDDAFAKTVGKFENLIDLKAKLKENLELDADLKEKERFESDILSTLAGKIQTEIPDVLLQGELDKMGRELEQSLVSQGASFEDYLKAIGKSLDELKKGWVEQANKRIKIGLLIRAIAKKENVAATAEEADVEINATLRQNPGNKEVVKTVESPAYKDYVKQIIVNRKTIKLLSSWAEGKKN